MIRHTQNPNYSHKSPDEFVVIQVMVPAALNDRIYSVCLFGRENFAFPCGVVLSGLMRLGVELVERDNNLIRGKHV
jgi:hypothetical protein